jgi:microcystin-dependent protein
MWHGLIANIPSGWVICDGNNSTPDLLAKFVEGVATAATDPGATGGAANVTLSLAQMPAHNHSFNFMTNVGAGGSRIPGSTGYDESNTRNTTSKGSSSTHENRPPFYDVAFIMKT